MARVGKITVYVNQGAVAQQLSVRTTGAYGTVPLNTVTIDASYPTKTSESTAKAFWTDILNLVQAQIALLP